MKKYSNTDVTRIGWEELVTRDKSQPETFKHLNSCLSVEKRESFDDTNKTLNSLNDEILKLKRQLKIAQEKDTEIEKLKNENKKLYIELETISKKSDKTHQLEKEIRELKKQLETNDVNKELEKENIVMKRELHRLKNRGSIPEETIDFGVNVQRKIKLDKNALKVGKPISLKLARNVLDSFFNDASLDYV